MTSPPPGVEGRPGRGAGVPWWLDRAAAIAWRCLILAAAALVIGVLLSRLLVVVVPVIVALFLSTILTPPTSWLRRHRWPPVAATWAVFLAVLALFAALVAWMVPSVVHQFSQVNRSADRGLRQVQDWLVRGPLHLSRRDVKRDFRDAGRQLSANAGGLALRGVTLVGELAAGLLLSLVLTFFFVKDGPSLTASVLRFAGERHADDLREVGRRAWSTLGAYIRGTTINGLVNGALMTGGLAVIGVPLAVPLGVLTFFGAYFPIVGAIVTGLLAALVALVSSGPAAALIVVGLTIVIHNVEGYLVGPLVLGRAVHLHTVVVLLALAIGGVLGGVIGAFVAVPTTAIIASTVEYYRGGRSPDSPSPPSAHSRRGRGTGERRIANP